MKKAFPELQKYAYGTPEFKTALGTIDAAIKHHYWLNDHHPEHFIDGVNGMTLVQIVEMVCDWLAASGRSGTPLSMGLEINKARFHIDDQLALIIQNTVEWYDLQKSLS